MKYTIELTEKQANQLNDIMIGINASWGYASAPKLKMDIPLPMKESPAYKKGLEDGNKIADKDLKAIRVSTYNTAYNKALNDVDHAIDVLKDMTGAECAEWFEDCVGVDEVVCGFTIQRIVEITKAYEEKKKAEEIEVGDEVYSVDPNDKSVVTSVDKETKRAAILTIRGKCASIRFSDAHKTGRHFEEIPQLLDKLRGEE